MRKHYLFLASSSRYSIGLIGYRINTKVKDAQESRQGSKDTFDTTEFSLISSGDTCKYLDNPIYARISIGKCEVSLFLYIGGV